MTTAPVQDVFIYFMTRIEGMPFTKDVVEAHVAHLKRLDDAGRLVLSGPFRDGKGGMVAFRAADLAEAESTARSDPFISQGFETYMTRQLEVACRANGFLMG